MTFRRILLAAGALVQVVISSIPIRAALVASEPAGFLKIAINPGANFISAPLHRLPTARGVAGSATADSITMDVSPAWTSDQFGKRDGYVQFIVILRKSTAGEPSYEGDWWPVLASTADTLTVDSRGENVGSIVRPGDHIEVRHLTSLKDLFGSGASCILNKDSNGIPNNSQEDIIRLVSGTGFSTTIFYHDGTAVAEGYYVNGVGPRDGSTITLWPDQPAMVFRKAGSAPTYVMARGQAQMSRLSHYLHPGANAISSPFPVAAPISTSGLLQSGWTKDVNGIPNASQEDLLRPVTGTSLGAPLFYHDGTLVPAGWYRSGVLDNSFPIEPGKGYLLLLNGTDSFVWSQSPPY